MTTAPRRAAFFDIDGTLLAGPSLETRLFRRLRYRRAIPARNYLLWLANAFRLAPLGMSAMRHANKMYLRGVDAGAADARNVFRAEAPGKLLRLFPAAIQRMAWHAKQRDRIILLSGTLEPLAAQVALSLERQLAQKGCAPVIRLCATRLEEVKGRWTGCIAGEAMYGKAKAIAASRMAALEGFSLVDCYAYGDTANDLWLLASVGHPAAVNPSPRLARTARHHGWPVLHWRQEPKASSAECKERETKRKELQRQWI